MVGDSFAHTEIASRLYDALRPALRGGPCTVVRADLKVLTERGTRARYPDLVVTCAPIRPGDSAVPEPLLIVEVLSETTATAGPSGPSTPLFPRWPATSCWRRTSRWPWCATAREASRSARRAASSTYRSSACPCRWRRSTTGWSEPRGGGAPRAPRLGGLDPFHALPSPTPANLPARYADRGPARGTWAVGGGIRASPSPQGIGSGGGGLLVVRLGRRSGRSCRPLLDVPPRRSRRGACGRSRPSLV